MHIPRYFAQDFLQRTAPGSLYRESWPSLFVGPAGTRSSLHIDAFGSNFWMALFSGRKRWTLFTPDQVPALEPEIPAHSFDPVFGVQNEAAWRARLGAATPMECVLEPGDLLFVPAGCPHTVTNLEPTVALSANFVDTSNFDLVCRELEAEALMQPGGRASELLAQFRDPCFDREMVLTASADVDVPYAAFKRSGDEARS